MEILGAADACFMVGDDLFDFTLHGDSDLTTSSSSFTAATAAAAFGDESLSGSFPVFEEELEWLSNKDVFPGVETCFGILSDNPELLLSHHSPSSVLENSSSSSSSNSNSNSNSSDGNGSLKIPVRPRSKGRRRRRRASYGELPDQAMWLSQVAINYKQELTTMNGGGRMGRRCLHCQSDKTPQWRAGPMGPKTLCNACGVRYKSGRLLPEYRPANSPTFSTKLHSNSHRRVVEMRRQTTELGGGSILG